MILRAPAQRIMGISSSDKREKKGSGRIVNEIERQTERDREREIE